MRRAMVRRIRDRRIFSDIQIQRYLAIVRSNKSIESLAIIRVASVGVIQSMKKELDYTKKKIDAGADGLFSQPFFDLNLAEIYLDQLQRCNLIRCKFRPSILDWEDKDDGCFENGKYQE